MIAADILLDGFFAAVAAVGFGAVSDPPMRAFQSWGMPCWPPWDTPCGSA